MPVFHSPRGHKCAIARPVSCHSVGADAETFTLRHALSKFREKWRMTRRAKFKRAIKGAGARCNMLQRVDILLTALTRSFRHERIYFNSILKLNFRLHDKIHRKWRCGAVYPISFLWQHFGSALATWYLFCACSHLVRGDVFKQSLCITENSGSFDFLFPRRCLFFLHFLRILPNSVDSHFFVPVLKVPVFEPKKVRENFEPFRESFWRYVSLSG